MRLSARIPFRLRPWRALLIVGLLLSGHGSGIAQQPSARDGEVGQPEDGPELPPGATLSVEPSELTLEVGDTATLRATLLDRDEVVEGHPVVFFSRDRRRVGVDATGEVVAHGPGEIVVVALVPKDPEDEPRRAEPLLQVEIPVTVNPPPAASVEVVGLPPTLYAGTVLPLAARVVDITEVERQDIPVSWETSDPAVAVVDATGHLELVSAGRFALTAAAEDRTDTVELTVRSNPLDRIAFECDAEVARTGDVVQCRARPLDADGREIPHLPVHLAFSGTAAAGIVAPGALGAIYPDGKFVAERSGTYTLTATSGTRAASRRIAVEPRRVRKDLRFVGQGKVRDRHTSDLWVWEGIDGSDYAITGTWGAEGHAYIWDVTNPESIALIDTVKVDARTVNDVKVSADGKIAVISREGASDRKNGFVVLDVSEPKVGVRVISRFDDQLRGGVHNVFVHDRHVYAVNNGRRFDIVNLEDPTQPYRVGRFELDTPGHAIHDVWVVDGVAFTSNWDDGVYAIDVGGGGRGGSPNHPVVLGSVRYPSGWNHAAFPYKSQSTGKFYVFAGDEAFPYGLSGREEGEAPPRADGWIHIVEWDDWDEPREVARYQVPEAGTHNLWIENDTLYVAYYNGGLRVVDVSGELRGDLYRQGREIAAFMPYDPEGFIPNSPFTWGPQPHKGRIFFSDWNSGLWAVELVDVDAERELGEPQ